MSHFSYNTILHTGVPPPFIPFLPLERKSNIAV